MAVHLFLRVVVGLTVTALGPHLICKYLRVLLLFFPDKTAENHWQPRNLRGAAIAGSSASAIDI